MLRLTPDQYKTLAHLKRLPDGRAFIALLEAALEDVNVSLRTATGEKLGWLQGEAQCLAGWLGRIGEADGISSR